MVSEPLEHLNHSHVAEQMPVQMDEVAFQRLIMFWMSGVGHRQDLCPVLIWPVGDEVRQLELFKKRVAPQVMR